jgi:hypothetical protein
MNIPIPTVAPAEECVTAGATIVLTSADRDAIPYSRYWLAAGRRSERG